MAAMTEAEIASLDEIVTRNVDTVMTAWAAARLAFLDTCPAEGMVELSDAVRGRAALVSEDVRTPGMWRVTTFDCWGASGHFCDPTREKALLSARQAGYEVVAPGAVDAVIDWAKAGT